MICIQGEHGDDGDIGPSGKAGSRGKAGGPGLPGEQGSFGPKVKEYVEPYKIKTRHKSVEQDNIFWGYLLKRTG